MSTVPAGSVVPDEPSAAMAAAINGFVDHHRPRLSNSLLVDFLTLAVPLEIQRLSHLELDQIAGVARASAQTVTEKGDIIQWKAPGAAAATAALIRGLAALAYAPGGVTFMGWHWCTDHAECLNPTPQPATPAAPARCPVTTVASL